MLLIFLYLLRIIVIILENLNKIYKYILQNPLKIVELIFFRLKNK